MNTLSVIGKFLDQPRLVGKFQKAVPAALIGAGLGMAAYDTYKAPEQDKEKTLIKHACVLTGTIASALVTVRGIGKMEGLAEHSYNLKEIAKNNTKLVDDFIKNNPVSEKVGQILEKAKTKILNPKEIKTVYGTLPKNAKTKDFLDEFIPAPEGADSKEILGEIGKLSLLGLTPVVGGIAGGIAGDRLTEKNWKKDVPNKIKEGTYQYLANIFLCNVGAGAALGVMEKAKVKSKAVKAAGMLAGIAAFGVIGGSAMANFIGQKVLQPILNKDKNGKKERLYDERKPEALDVGLHIDDVATVGVLSGLKWIEPALPILYSISGYRAGIGYRNGDKVKTQSPIDSTKPKVKC